METREEGNSNVVGRYTPKKYIDSDVEPDELDIPEKRTILAPRGAIFPDGFDLNPVMGKDIMETLALAKAVESGNVLIYVEDQDLEFIVHNLPTLVGLNLVLYMDAPKLEYTRAWYLKATTLPSITPQEIEHEVKVATAKARPRKPEAEQRPQRRRPFEKREDKGDQRAAFQQPEDLGLDDANEYEQ